MELVHPLFEILFGLKVVVKWLMEIKANSCEKRKVETSTIVIISKKFLRLKKSRYSLVDVGSGKKVLITHNF